MTATIVTARTLIDSAALSAPRCRQRTATPAALARQLVPSIAPRYTITPAVALIGNALADAITSPDARLIITVPPRESKSTTVAVAGTLWALSRNPDTNVILASYADELAQEHSHKAAPWSPSMPECLGSRSRRTARRWAAGRSTAAAADCWRPESCRESLASVARCWSSTMWSRTR